jgi:hypothetical protein
VEHAQFLVGLLQYFFSSRWEEVKSNCTSRKTGKVVNSHKRQLFQHSVGIVVGDGCSHHESVEIITAIPPTVFGLINLFLTIEASDYISSSSEIA